MISSWMLSIEIRAAPFIWFLALNIKLSCYFGAIFTNCCNLHTWYRNLQQRTISKRWMRKLFFPTFTYLQVFDDIWYEYMKWYECMKWLQESIIHLSTFKELYHVKIRWQKKTLCVCLVVVYRQSESMLMFWIYSV